MRPISFPLLCVEWVSERERIQFLNHYTKTAFNSFSFPFVFTHTYAVWKLNSRCDYGERTQNFTFFPYALIFAYIFWCLLFWARNKGFCFLLTNYRLLFFFLLFAKTWSCNSLTISTFVHSPHGEIKVLIICCDIDIIPYVIFNNQNRPIKHFSRHFRTIKNFSIQLFDFSVISSSSLFFQFVSSFLCVTRKKLH